MDFNDIAIEWKKGIIIFGIVLALSACDNMAVASSTTANGASSVSESVKEDTAKVANETKEKAENDAKKAWKEQRAAEAATVESMQLQPSCH